MKGIVKLASCAALLWGLNSTSAAMDRTAFVHLFEWQWNDIATECENVLGPKGYAAVQVSPPQKSINGNQWWTRYQPVSYAIEGRSGTRQEFINMVQRCDAVGVDIYVDAVINHMAAWDRNFPEVPFGPNDFHNCTDDINYGDRWSVQNCDLVGLNDLATESNYVQQKIADYMNDLTNIGVKGFRIDAAKHMPANDINGIVSRLNGSPYIFQEVIGAGGEPVLPSEYTWIGDVTEFNYTRSIGHHFKGRGPINALSNIGTWGGWLNSSDAVVFVANHDNQRQDTANTITHKDGNNANVLAHVFMLAWPYGYPKVMSSYDWNDHDQGPPSSGAAGCNNGWLCEHRIRAIANMVGFRNQTASNFGVNNYWSNGNNQIAFSRGDQGFVVINNEGSNLNRSFQTGLAAGEYCDIINGDFNSQTQSCNGATITVDSNGNASINLNGFNASAIHAGAKVNTACTNCPPPPPTSTLFTCNQAFTNPGQAVFITGDQTALGNWNPANAIALDGSNAPSWTGSVNLAPNTAVEWKCIKRDANNPNGAVEWQSGGNNQFNTSQTNAVSTSFDGTTPPPPPPPANVDVSFSCGNGNTYMGQSVYAVGNIAALGNWNVANAALLSPNNYPNWQASVSLPSNTAVEWKCVKREENNANAGVEWQGGANNQFNTGTTNSSQSAAF